MTQSDEPEERNWYSDELATFGDRLADARAAVNMSQADLARRLGVRLKTLQNWEHDLSEPRANKVSMVSGLLNVSLRWLLTGEGEGLDMPDSTPSSPDIAPILTDLRQTQSDLVHMSNRLGRLEKRLKTALAEVI